MKENELEKYEDRIRKEKTLKHLQRRHFKALEDGGDCWTRTSDLLRVKQAL